LISLKEASNPTFAGKGKKEKKRKVEGVIKSAP
jgi:hypothetical protein